MSILEFNLIKSIFSGGKLDPEKQKKLYAELLFLVLTRASAADLNIEAAEVETIQRVLKDKLDQDFTAADIRVAALTKLYEFAPFEKYVSKMSKNIPLEYRMQIIDAVAEVFTSDGTTGVLETDFFNSVANALELTPAQIRKL